MIARICLTVLLYTVYCISTTSTIYDLAFPSLLSSSPSENVPERRSAYTYTADLHTSLLACSTSTHAIVTMSSLIVASSPATGATSAASSTSNSASIPTYPTASIWVKHRGSVIPVYPTFTAADARHYDVCVVGGGMVGMTTAYVLKRSGKKVVLLEARDIGHGTTGYSTAKLTSNQNLLYHSLVKKHGHDTAQLYGTMQEACINEIEKIVNECQLQCGFSRRSHATWTTDEKQAEEVKAEAENARSLGLPARFLTTAASIGVRAAVHFTNQAQYNAYQFVTELSKHVVGNGCNIFEHTLVNHISDDKDQAHTVTSTDGIAHGRFGRCGNPFTYSRPFRAFLDPQTVA